MTRRFEISAHSCLFAMCVAWAAAVAATPETDAIESLVEQGQFDQALVATERELARDQGNVNFLFLKGLILTRQNDLERARDIFLEITMQHPELPEPYNNLAVIYAAQGDYNSARDALQKAINTHPSYATAHENMGDIYAKMASRAYNQALELDQENETAREKLALVNDLFPVENPEQSGGDTASRAEAEATRTQLATLEQELQQAREETRREKDNVSALLDQLQGQQAESARQLEQVRREQESLSEQLQQARSQLAVMQEGRSAPTPVAEPVSGRDESGVRAVDDAADVLRAVTAWARSWSEKDVAAYLASYGSAFRPPPGFTRRGWEAQRRQRISAPRLIHVEVIDPRVSFPAAGRAQVTFEQDYRSDTYNDHVRKTLYLALQSGRWLIEKEVSD